MSSKEIKDALKDSGLTLGAVEDPIEPIKLCWIGCKYGCWHRCADGCWGGCYTATWTNENA
jgi:hypothetical protein